MPHEVDVACPSWGERATFQFAETVRIKRKIDVTYFRESPIFEYRCVEGNAR